MTPRGTTNSKTSSSAVREPMPAGDAPLDASNDAPDDGYTPSQGLDPNGVIEMEALGQILDLDEDDTHNFSRDIAWAYFNQAEDTFQYMRSAYLAKDLPALSSLGHFLKSSSAALGVSKVQGSCEQVQHYGGLRDEAADRDLRPDEALEMIRVTLERVKVEYAEAATWLKDYYKCLGSGEKNPPVST